MSREVVALSNLARRMPEHGRIRLGEKGNKGQPVKLDHPRFTSRDKKAIDEIAHLYGGTPRPWADKQYEVKTEADEIPVVLPPDPLGGTPIYELWSKGGCQRRCNGVVCTVSEETRDGFELVEVDCICSKNESLECKPTTRLNVVLPEITFGGAWRLESNGWHVAHEMPGMVEAILEFSQRGYTRAVLAMESRKSVKNGRTQHYVVPVIRPAVSLEALVSGEGSLRAISPAPLAELVDAPDSNPGPERGEGSIPSGGTFVDTSWEDDDVVDAEIVEEDCSNEQASDVERAEGSSSSTSVDSERPFTEPDQPMAEEMAAAKIQIQRRRLMAILNELGMGATERHALVKKVTKGRATSSNDLDGDEMTRLISAVEAIRSGKAELQSIDSDGVAVVVRL